MADFEKIAMQIISYAGEGKYKVKLAVEAFGNGNDEEFNKLMVNYQKKIKGLFGDSKEIEDQINLSLQDLHYDL